jgi:hypothetical protein
MTFHDLREAVDDFFAPGETSLIDTSGLEFPQNHDASSMSAALLAGYHKTGENGI